MRKESPPIHGARTGYRTDVVFRFKKRKWAAERRLKQSAPYDGVARMSADEESSPPAVLVCQSSDYRAADASEAFNREPLLFRELAKNTQTRILCSSLCVR